MQSVGKPKRNIMETYLFCKSLDSVEVDANVRRNHFHCLILRQRLESTPLVLQLCQRLDARLLNTYTSTYTSPPPLRRVVQFCQRCWAWLDQLCSCLSWQQLRQRLEHFFCGLNREIRQRLDLGCWLGRCVCHVVRHWQSDPCFSCLSGVLWDPSSVLT